MNTKAKVIAAILAIVLIFAFVALGKDDGGKADDNSNSGHGSDSVIVKEIDNSNSDSSTSGSGQNGEGKKDASGPSVSPKVTAGAAATAEAKQTVEPTDDNGKRGSGNEIESGDDRAGRQTSGISGKKPEEINDDGTVNRTRIEIRIRNETRQRGDETRNEFEERIRIRIEREEQVVQQAAVQELRQRLANLEQEFRQFQNETRQFKNETLAFRSQSEARLINLENRVRVIEGRLPAAPIVQTPGITPSVGAGGCDFKSNQTNLSDIIKRENRRSDVHFGQNITFRFTTGVIVEEVGFLAKVSLTGGCAEAEAQILKNRPAGVPINAPGNVVRYVNVWVGELGYGASPKVADPYIVFNTTSLPIQENETIKIMMFAGGQWVDLGTNKIGENLYRVSVAGLGFGNFAIIREPQAITIEEEPEEALVSDEPVTTEEPTEDAQPSTLVPGLILFGLLGIFASGLLYEFKQKHGQAVMQRIREIIARKPAP